MLRFYGFQVRLSVFKCKKIFNISISYRELKASDMFHNKGITHYPYLKYGNPSHFKPPARFEWDNFDAVPLKSKGGIMAGLMSMNNRLTASIFLRRACA